MIDNACRVFLIWSKALVFLFLFSSLFCFGGGSPFAGGNLSGTAVEEAISEEHFIPGLVTVIIKDARRTSEVCSSSKVDKYIKEVGNSNGLEILGVESVRFPQGECNYYVEVEVPDDQVQATINAFEKETEIVDEAVRTEGVRR